MGGREGVRRLWRGPELEGETGVAREGGRAQKGLSQLRDEQ